MDSWCKRHTRAALNLFLLLLLPSIDYRLHTNIPSFLYYDAVQMYAKMFSTKCYSHLSQNENKCTNNLVLKHIQNILQCINTGKHLHCQV